MGTNFLRRIRWEEKKASARENHRRVTLRLRLLTGELYLSLDSKIVLTAQYVRTYYLEDGQAFFTQPNFAGWAARPVSVRLSRSERARHLRGGGRPTRFVHQSFSFERGLRCGGARPVLRLLERIGERSAKR